MWIKFDNNEKITIVLYAVYSNKYIFNVITIKTFFKTLQKGEQKSLKIAIVYFCN